MLSSLVGEENWGKAIQHCDYLLVSVLTFKFWLIEVQLTERSLLRVFSGIVQRG